MLVASHRKRVLGRLRTGEKNALNAYEAMKDAREEAAQDAYEAMKDAREEDKYHE